MGIVLCLILPGCSDEGDEEKPPASNGDAPPDNNGNQNGDETPPAPLPGLPDDTAGYNTWLRLNANPIPPIDGGDAHRGTKNVFVNQTREAIAPGGQQQFPYPEGTIVVKESTRPGADFIGLIAIMRKKQGSDPAHNDWTFVEYTRNAADAEFSEVASGGVCTGCHSGARDTDYVWTRLE
jgi:hypothetical protein